MKILLLFCLSVTAVTAQESPTPKPQPELRLHQDSLGHFHYEPVKAPVKKPGFRLDTGWWTRAAAGAAAFDYISTRLLVQQCVDHLSEGFSCKERDPLARPLIGADAPAWRLAIVYPAEIIAIAAIPNRKVRRVVQVAAIGAHTYFAVRNVHSNATWPKTPK